MKKFFKRFSLSLAVSAFVVTMFSSIVVGTTVAHAETTGIAVQSVNSNEVSKSIYTNLIKNGYYSSQSKLKVYLNYSINNPTYILPNNWNIEAPKVENIADLNLGLVVDGILHDVKTTGHVEITTRGYHEIKVVRLYNDNNRIYAKKGEEPIEQYYIFFSPLSDLYENEDGKVVQKETIFFYEHYLDGNSLCERIEKSFAPQIKLSTDYKRMITSYWETNKKSNSTNPENTTKEVSIKIYNEITEKNEIYKISLKSTLCTDDGNINASFSGPLFIDTQSKYYTKMIGYSLDDICNSGICSVSEFDPTIGIDIEEKGNLIVNNIYYEVDENSSGVKQKIVKLYDNSLYLKMDKPLKYKLIDNFGNSHDFARDVYIINSSKMHTSLVVKGIDKEKQIKQFSIIDRNIFIEDIDCYTSITIGTNKFKTYQFSPQVDFNYSNVDTNKITKYYITYNFSDSLGNRLTNQKRNISIIDENKPIILSRYDFIYLPKDNIDSFKKDINSNLVRNSYFKIFDDIDINYKKTSYEFIDFNGKTDVGKIKITTEDVSGNKQELEVIVYFVDATYENGFINRYAKFIREILGIK